MGRTPVFRETEVKRKLSEVVSVNTETMLRTAEHERLLSFNEDNDALRFDDWWDLIGCESFSLYNTKLEIKDDRR